MSETKPETWHPIADGIVMSAGVQHKVIEARRWVNQHGATFTDWRAACGADGTASGGYETAPTGLVSNGRYHRLRKAACKACTAKGWL